ncbi:DUF2218 domain-containing protein [Novosphingobium mathurense]|uniref:DUF2218 domain-containing protein n=1 Tax=Novosphingobium mathurense TaxID=428990 RepID=A0A1U6ILR8_9SPHN|nr:hypothetical protein SAMN06295987_10950 [Novosphingobium mathurense]
MSASFSARGVFVTPNGSKYLQQLCKHWAYNLSVTFDEHRGEIVFPREGRGGNWPADAKVVLELTETGLACKIEASAEGQLEGLKGALARTSTGSRSVKHLCQLNGRRQHDA